MLNQPVRQSVSQLVSQTLFADCEITCGYVSMCLILFFICLSFFVPLYFWHSFDRAGPAALHRHLSDELLADPVRYHRWRGRVRGPAAVQHGETPDKGSRRCHRRDRVLENCTQKQTVNGSLHVWLLLFLRGPFSHL